MPGSIRVHAVFFALIAGAIMLSAQAASPNPLKVLRVSNFSGDALGAGEAQAIQNLVTSYVVELRLFRVIDGSGQELALREAETAVQLGIPKDISPLSADYILSATASRAGTLIIFTMEMTKASTGEKRSVSETAQTVNDLILASRRLTLGLLDRPSPQQPAVATPPTSTSLIAGQAPDISSSTPPLSAGSTPAPRMAIDPAPTIAKIVGTWKGDKGLDRISIFIDGHGIAILSTGVSVKVKVVLQGTGVIVMQDQASTPEMYRSSGLDYNTAKKIAGSARPWRWLFSLLSDGSKLQGVKESIFVKIDQSGSISIDNNYIRDSEWTRLFR